MSRDRLDDEAIRGFVRGDYPRLVAAVTMIVGERSVAEDLVDEALAVVWERSVGNREAEELSSAVTRATMTLLRRHRRRARQEGQALERVGRRLAASGDAGVDLAWALKRLPERQRQAIVLRYYLGLEIREVASALGVTVGTATVTLRRARLLLASVLDPTELQRTSGER